MASNPTPRAKLQLALDELWRSIEPVIPGAFKMLHIDQSSSDRDFIEKLTEAVQIVLVARASANQPKHLPAAAIQQYLRHAEEEP